MRISYSDDTMIDDIMLAKMTEAAELCVRKEGMTADDMEVSLSFVSEDEIRSLNGMYRDTDRPTDVLSFPLVEDFNDVRDGEEVLLGDVVICTDIAQRQAEEYGHSYERELIYLFVHSVCHLLGYDHMDEEERLEMRKREEEVMSEIGLQRD